MSITGVRFVGPLKNLINLGVIIKKRWCSAQALCQNMCVTHGNRAHCPTMVSSFEFYILDSLLTMFAKLVIK